MYTMYFSFRTAVLDCALLWYCQLYILCHIRISHYDGFIPGCLNISLVFALRCWTVPYYGTVSYVYYVFLDIPLIWDCHLSCMVLSDHTSVSFIYSLLVHQGTRQGLK